MTYPTREQIEEYIRNNKLDTDESYPRSDWWKFKQQRDEYKKQRDELRKDVAKLHEHNSELEHENKALRLQSDTYFEQWQDAKKKAQAFDEIVNAVEESANSYELVARIKLEVWKYQKLEREE